MDVFTPAVTAENSNWYRGTADAIYQNLQFLKDSHEPYVVIASGDCVYKLDYNKVLEYHIEKKADITVVCRDMEAGTKTFHILPSRDFTASQTGVSGAFRVRSVYETFE